MSEITFEQLEQKLAYLGSSIKRIASKAAMAGAEVISVAQKRAAPVALKSRKSGGKVILPGALKASINKRLVKTSGAISQAKTGLDVGKSKPGSQRVGGHGHLYVEGTEERWTGFERIRSKGRKHELRRTKSRIGYRGRAPSHKPSFIQVAADSAASSAWDVIKTTLSAEIDKAIEKQG